MITEVNQEQELKTEALTLVEHAKVIKIIDQRSYDDATSLLTKTIIPFKERIVEFFEPMRKAAHAAYQTILDKKKEHLGPVEQAEKTVKDAIRKWDDEQERIRQELQAKAQKEAEQKAIEERNQEAMMAEHLGLSEENVSEIMSAPVTAVAAPVDRTYERARGIGSRDNWKCKVNDIKALCRAVANGKVPAEYVLPNQSALDKRAKADKSLMLIPGCVSYNDSVVTARGR